MSLSQCTLNSKFSLIHQKEFRKGMRTSRGERLDEGTHLLVAPSATLGLHFLQLLGGIKQRVLSQDSP
jgi:hypothetical protein